MHEVVLVESNTECITSILNMFKGEKSKTGLLIRCPFPLGEGTIGALVLSTSKITSTIIIPQTANSSWEGQMPLPVWKEVTITNIIPHDVTCKGRTVAVK